MRFSGRIFREGKYWAIEVPVLDVVTQGRTRREAYSMIGDAVESLVNKKDFKVTVFPGRAGYFELGDYARDGQVMPDYILGYLLSPAADPEILAAARQFIGREANEVTADILRSTHGHRNARPRGRPVVFLRAGAST